MPEFHQKLIIQTMKLNWTKYIYDCNEVEMFNRIKVWMFTQAFNVFCVIYLETHCLPQNRDGKLHVKKQKPYRSFMIIRQLFKLIAIWSQLTGIRFVSKVSRCLILIALFNSMKKKTQFKQIKQAFSDALKTSLFIWIEFLWGWCINSVLAYCKSPLNKKHTNCNLHFKRCSRGRWWKKNWSNDD